MTRVTGLGAYTIPRVDVQVGATFRSDQGGALAANYTATNASIAPSLGRNLSNNAPNVTVNLIPPGTVYGDRVNALDLRFVKILRFGRTRSNVGFEFYNVTNSAAVLTYNQAFIPGRRVAHADVGAPVALRENQRADRLLRAFKPAPAPRRDDDDRRDRPPRRLTSLAVETRKKRLLLRNCSSSDPDVRHNSIHHWLHPIHEVTS